MSTEPQSAQPPEEEEGGIRYPDWYLRNRTLIRRVAITLSVSSSALVVAGAMLVVSRESAHDEATCPFVAVSSVTEGDVVVRDEARSCVDGVVEHRWILERASSGGDVPFELGRRRLSAERYGSGSYTWRVFVEDRHARVHVENDGAPPVTYREEVARSGRVAPPSGE